MKVRNFFIQFICLAFLVYGALRIGVSSLLLLQAAGSLSLPDLQEGLLEVYHFMAMIKEQALIPFTSITYLIYLWLMGLLLVTGAIGCTIRKPFGLYALYSFLIMYAGLFINFQTINPKVIHLLACAILVVAYKWLIKANSRMIKD